MHKRIIEFIQQYETLWYDMPTTFPEIQPYCRNDQKEREQTVLQALDKIAISIEARPKNSADDTVWRSALAEEIQRTAKPILQIQDKELEQLVLDGFMEVAKVFYDQAHQICPNVHILDIMQALRNVWIMNLFQLILCKPVHLTPSIFAYSMLYPYTDNYLDDPARSADQKTEFNRRLSLKLNNEDVVPHCAAMETVFSLIDMIMEQYPYNDNTIVYDCIMAIQQGQESSLLQQSGCCSPFERPLLSISVEKGGTSVLADACLIDGDISGSLADWSFGFGFLLQLIDDLQDITTDQQNLHMTIFSQTSGKWPLDHLTNKLFHLTTYILDRIPHGSPHLESLRHLIHENTLHLIFQSIQAHRDQYSTPYLHAIESQCPVRLKFYPKIEKRMKKLSKKAAL